MRSLLRKIQRAKSLSIGEWRVFLEAWLTLVSAQIQLSLAPRRTVSEALRISTNDAGGLPDARLLELFAMARNNTPRYANCLPRSIALQQFLKRRGLHPRLLIGGRRNGNQLEGHAWLELNGEAIAEAPDVRERFTPFMAETDAVLAWYAASPVTHRDEETA